MRRTAFVASGLVLAASLNAQQPEPLKALRWRSVGPANNAGRVSVVAGVPGNRDTYYVAGANGGIIKTTNGGVTFRPIFDRQDIGSIGAIAIAPSDPNVIYVGTGEENPRNNASIGDGMYKSVDAGEHWTHIGLVNSDKIARIVDRREESRPRLRLCGSAASGARTRSAASSRRPTAARPGRRCSTSIRRPRCSDIATDPTNSNIIYAGMYTYRRWAWHLESGGGNTAVYKSVDGGDTWERLSGKDRERGLPKGDMDRIGIAVAPSDPNVVYVVSETKTEGELWRSDDAGAHWRTVNRDPNINFRPFYYADIRVDPRNPNRVYSLSGSLYESEDGGQNFRTIGSDVHGDHQALWIDPLNPKRILSGSDGGWQVSYDGGRTFEVVNTFAFTQFYHINYDMQKPYMVCGGLQDNGNWCGPSQSASRGAIHKSDWFTVSRRRRLLHRARHRAALAGLLRRAGRDDQHHRHAHGHAEDHLSVPEPRRLGRRHDAEPQVSLQLELADRALAAESGRSCTSAATCCSSRQNHGMSWEVISPDLIDERPDQARRLGRPDRRRQHGGRVPLHDHLHRAVAARLERDLGRHRRRQRAGDARRRQDVDERRSGTCRDSSRTRGSRRSTRRTPTPAPRTSRPTTTRTTTTRRTRT